MFASAAASCGSRKLLLLLPPSPLRYCPPYHLSLLFSLPPPPTPICLTTVLEPPASSLEPRACCAMWATVTAVGRARSAQMGGRLESKSEAVRAHGASPHEATRDAARRRTTPPRRVPNPYQALDTSRPSPRTDWAPTKPWTRRRRTTRSTPHDAPARRRMTPAHAPPPQRSSPVLTGYVSSLPPY